MSGNLCTYSRLAVTMLLAALTAGCQVAVYAPITPADAGSSASDGAVATSGPVHSLVFDRVVLRTDDNEIDQSGVWPWKRPNYTRFNNYLDFLKSMGVEADLQRHQDHVLCSGDALNLMLALPDPVLGGNNVLGKMWHAQKTDCCRLPLCVDLMFDRCVPVAIARCFAGDASFKPVLHSQSPTFIGKAGGQDLALGPADVPFVFTIPGAGRIELRIHGAMITGTIKNGRIVNGRLFGGVGVADLKRRLCPATARALYHTYSNTSKSWIRNPIIGLMDVDGDGTFSESEATCTTYLSSLLEPDMDMDGNGSLDHFSMRVGFTAVQGKILDN